MLGCVPDMETAYISAKEASNQTGLSQRRINQMVALGDLPGIRIGNSNAIEKGTPALQRLKRMKGERLAKKNGKRSK